MLNTKTEKLDRRVIRTRKLLREAFLELMFEQDFQGITVQDITDHAMINRATFYAHFEDKYALFDHTIKTMFQDHLEQNIPHANHLTHENLRLLSLSTLTFLSQFMGHCAPSHRNDDLPFEKQIQTHLSEILHMWISNLDPSIIAATTSIELVSIATSSAIFGSAIYHARGRSTLSQEDYITQLMMLLVNGVCPVVAEKH